MTKKRRAGSKKASPTSETVTTQKSSTAASRRQTSRAARERKRKMRTYTLIAVGVVLIGLLVFVVGQGMFKRPGELVLTQGNTHVGEAEVEAFEYNSRPPTSGPHLGSILPWGVYDEPVPEGRQIHNLEDGGVGLWFDCPEGCPELVAQLEGIVSDKGEDGLVMAPYSDMETRIALTAWNRIDRLEEFDEQRITNFIKAYRGIDHHAQ